LEECFLLDHFKLWEIISKGCAIRISSFAGAEEVCFKKDG
jgi:hypothetical protein